MKCRPVTNISTARTITRSAQQRIKNKTGMGVSLLLYTGESNFKTPQRMLHVIALALNMNPEYYRMRTREREIAEMRFLGAHFLRSHFPRITLHQIAALFGGLDHSTVISGLMRAQDLIYTGDIRFINKYKTAAKAIDIWLRKEASTYALAASA